uniref:Uncharacterized protein n=2 Tax=Physcomitrium patens TaxID=3218 RepID=A0A2K1KNT4_PHYPA|nr:hypothetical protein PHYPA_006336 [Physcomitrium patens]
MSRSSNGLGWADQWDPIQDDVPTNNPQKASSKTTNKERMASAKAAASVGVHKTKAAAIIGMQKTKVVASISAQKLKAGTTAGIKLIKEKTQRKEPISSSDTLPLLKENRRRKRNSEQSNIVTTTNQMSLIKFISEIKGALGTQLLATASHISKPQNVLDVRLASRHCMPKLAEPSTSNPNPGKKGSQT